MKKLLLPLALVGSLFIATPAKAVELEDVSTFEIAKNLASRTLGNPFGAAAASSVVAGALGISYGRAARKGIRFGAGIIGRGIGLVGSYKPKTKIVEIIFKFISRNVDVAEEALYRKLANYSPRLLNRYKTVLGGEEEAVLTLWEVAKQIDKLDRINNIPESELPPLTLFELLQRLEYLQEQHDTIVDAAKGLFAEYSDDQLDLLTQPD